MSTRSYATGAGGGGYHLQWLAIYLDDKYQAQATWVTLVCKLTNTVVPTLPKTGY